MRLVVLALAAVVALLSPAPAGAQASPRDGEGVVLGGEQGDGEGEGSERWCAPELIGLDGDVCAALPKREAEGPRTLVVFLHGVIKPGSGWQWAQQRAAARVASTHGVAALMPRGRRGHGPKGMEDWWTWPTSAVAQDKLEASLIDEWSSARGALEARAGHKFDRVWVFGFSNGAYYATSLALRGRLGAGAPIKADGFAAFAGGSAAPYLERIGRKAKARPPLFVAWGGRDKDHGNQVKLARMLHTLGWPSRSSGAPRAGHAMTDKQAREAVQFLGQPRGKRLARGARGSGQRSGYEAPRGVAIAGLALNSARQYPGFHFFKEHFYARSLFSGCVLSDRVFCPRHGWLRGR